MGIQLETRNSSLWFKRGGNGTLLKVLDSISLRVHPGEFVLVLGPSGCGKTSLLRLFGGLIEPSDKNTKVEGEVIVNGQTPSDAKRNRLFGFAFQNPALLPWRTVRENVVLPLEIACKPSVEDWQRVSEILKLVDIADFAGSYPRELSGGMQQRVNIARAIIHKPSILLMDEPFGSLDEVTRERLNLALHSIQRTNGHTVVFVTHNLREAVLLADRIVILTKRPASVKATFESNLPSVRTEDLQMSHEYLDLLAKVRDCFFSSEDS